MEDDLLLSDPEFFAKILTWIDVVGATLPTPPMRAHPGQGDVILSGILMVADRTCLGYR